MRPAFRYSLSASRRGSPLAFFPCGVTLANSKNEIPQGRKTNSPYVTHLGLLLRKALLEAGAGSEKRPAVSG